MGRRGRPTKLTADVQRRLVEQLDAGATILAAAAASEVSPRTLHRWLDRGRLGEGLFAQFRVEVERVRAERRAARRCMERDPAALGAVDELPALLDQRDYDRRAFRDALLERDAEAGMLGRRSPQA